MRKNYIYSRLFAIYSVFMRTYRYRLEITNSRTTRNNLEHFFKSIQNIIIKRKKILFFPDGPKQFHALFKILLFLGYRFENDEKKRYHMAIKWWLAFDGYPFAPVEAEIAFKDNKKNGIRMLNNRCNDISKQHINLIFEEVFGYPIAINPTKFVGPCVMKSNWNALHQGKIIVCPTEYKEENVVYQKLVKNEMEDGTVEDMRVPIFEDNIPFVYLKYRPIDVRFVDRAHTNLKAKIVEVHDVLSHKETDKILQFCKKIGLDYGEIDVLRDSVDSRIYIVDVNNTPSGPTSCISKEDAKTAVFRLAQAFEDSFCF